MTREEIVKSFESQMVTFADPHHLRLKACEPGIQPFQEFHRKIEDLEVMGYAALQALFRTMEGEHPNDMIASLIVHREKANSVDGTTTSMALRKLLSQQEKYINVEAFKALEESKALLKASFEKPQLLPYLDAIQSSNLEAERLMIKRTLNHMSVCASYCEDPKTRSREHAEVAALTAQVDAIAHIMNRVGFQIDMGNDYDWKYEVSSDATRKPSAALKVSEAVLGQAVEIQKLYVDFREISKTRGVISPYYAVGADQFYTNAKQQILKLMPTTESLDKFKSSIIAHRDYHLEQLKYDKDVPSMVKVYQLDHIKSSAQRFMKMGQEIIDRVNQAPEPPKPVKPIWDSQLTI